MLKKIALITALTITFLFGGAFVLNTVGHDIAFAQGEPSENLESGDFMFSLSGSGGGHDTSIVHPDINPQSWIRGGINYIFERIIGLLAAVIGGLSVLMMSVGGFLILTSAGVENQVTKGKGYIWGGLKGLVFTLGAYILVTAVQILIKSIYA